MPTYIRLPPETQWRLIIDESPEFYLCKDQDNVLRYIIKQGTQIETWGESPEENNQ